MYHFQKIQYTVTLLSDEGGEVAFSEGDGTFSAGTEVFISLHQMKVGSLIHGVEIFQVK